MSPSPGRTQFSQVISLSLIEERLEAAGGSRLYRPLGVAGQHPKLKMGGGWQRHVSLNEILVTRGGLEDSNNKRPGGRTSLQLDALRFVRLDVA